MDLTSDQNREFKKPDRYRSKSLHTWAVLRKKVPNVLSRRHTKRMTPTFSNFLKKKKVLNFFFFWKSQCHTKRRAVEICK